MFVILTELGQDYGSGGLLVYHDQSAKSGKLLDVDYRTGDLVIFDQARLEHEVAPVQKTSQQIGRLQYYIPSIPYGYIDELIKFEDYESQLISTRCSSMMLSRADRDILAAKPVHYSRLNYFKRWI